MLIFDAHLDLSLNAMNFNRDLSLPVEDLRRFEIEQQLKGYGRGAGTVTLPEMRRAKAGLCVATQIGHCENFSNPLPGWQTPEQAWAQTQGQLAWYRAMEEAGEMKQISSLKDLEEHLALWLESETSYRPIGYMLSLEGADSIVNPGYLEQAFEYGLRALGPAHYGPGIYANGTDASGGFPERGRELLKKMDELGIILDVTHLCDECFWEALGIFQGRIWASHSNCRQLVPHNRQFSDEQIKALIERNAVIGVALDAWMLIPGWIRGKTTAQESGLTLESALDHIDHICQLAGNARHCGIGSDLDGGFGREQTPQDLDTIADLQKLPGMLSRRGYRQEDIEGIAHGNFVRFLRATWR